MASSLHVNLQIATIGKRTTDPTIWHGIITTVAETIRTIRNVSKTNHKAVALITNKMSRSGRIYSMWPKVLPHVKQNPFIINQNHIFFKIILGSHFWIDFNKFHTKTFRIVYILTVYLLIMFI